MEFETFTTRLGATGIVVNSHKFIKIKDSKSTILWRCSTKRCRISCSTDKDKTEILRKPIDHNHEPNTGGIETERIREACKRRAVSEINERATKVVCQEAKEGTNFREFVNLKNCVYRAR
ncbi:hypothetical protein ElyMa_003410200 [Elysia marginata]|uniref:FLYWCH-type domain-containing protein n=1 Tax=Elysia marginata TaxID=1093978 RepID=A0AAV4JS83_9GAST|nr:hypothetical protein ElyMa_003410200 [Elysia marginata]